MNCCCINASLTKLLHQSVGAVLGSCEDNAARDLFIKDDVSKNSALVRFAREHNMLVNTVNCNLLGAHVNGDCVTKKGVGKACDATGHGGAKEQVLTFLWQEFEHLLNVTDKAHVQHSVGFIKNKEFNM